MLRDLIIPSALVAVVGSLLLPLPPHVLDFLLVGNLLIALLLVVSTLYVSDSLKLSALPTILLLATLYRLSLNVATTRLILGSGDAGATVQAFGTVVIGGNLAVGIVVFLIITMIQFIVIAKGSERVAEVAARFALDALPGKQMSIDADVRAGLIDFEAARRRRADLQTESRFYGALDGAMKFVKGDAIVGILIVAVNIIGGLSVGLLVEGLELQHALSKYTILTVGDGLLAQIPALLNALAAGLVVTRVGRDEDKSLATELLSQLGQVRKAKVLIACLALILAFVPGMPMLPFAGLAMILGISAAVRIEPRLKSEIVKFEPKTPPLLQLVMSQPDLARLQIGNALVSSIQELRRDIYERSGLLLLPPDISQKADRRGEVNILIRGVTARVVRVEGDNPKTAAKELMSELQKLIGRRALELVDDVLTRRTLDLLEREAPELVSAAVPGSLSVTQLTGIIKALVGEGVSVRNFDIILQAVVENGSKHAGDRSLVEEVRIALGRVILQPHLTAEQSIEGYLIDPALDLPFALAERENKVINPEIMDFMIESCQGLTAPPLVLVSSKAARRMLYECLKLRGVSAVVLAHEEIPDDIGFEARGKIVPPAAVREELIERLAA